MLPVITPFFNQQQGCELELSILSWNKFFRTPFQRIIIGDHHPCLDEHPEVKFIHCPRIGVPKGDNYRKHLDIATKLQLVCQQLPPHTIFLRTPDDCYPVNPFSFEDIKPGLVHADYIRGRENHPNMFFRDKFRTRRLLQQLSLPYKDYTTHSPIIYDTTLLLELIDHFDLTHQSYVLEDLYFNYYHSHLFPTPLSDNKATLFPDPLIPYCANADTAARLLPPLIADHLWLFNTMESWSPAAEQYLLSRLQSIT